MLLFKAITQPWKIISSRRLPFLSDIIPDKLFLRCAYRSALGQNLNLETPTNYNEKLQWLKINDRDDRYTEMVDKYEMKKYAASIIGEEYIIPIIGVWEDVESIDFEELPDRFVLKCTHDSAGLVICNEKELFDIESAKKKLNRCLKRNFYYSGREWVYKNIKPRIIAEKYMEDSILGELRDYKFFIFNGKAKIVHIVSNRQNEKEETYGDFFDMDYKHLDLTMGHENAPILPQKPINFEKMKEFAEILSKNAKHLRVDFYEVNGKLFLGELTFYQDSGFANIQPPVWNDILGSWIDL